MLRLIGNRIVIPRGDTGAFVLPMPPHYTEGEDIVVFSVYSPITHEVVIEKRFSIYDCAVCVDIEYNDTKNLQAGKYIWDIKTYVNPTYDEDGNIIDALQVDSYYNAHDLPLFVVKEANSLPEINYRKETMARLIKQC